MDMTPLIIVATSVAATLTMLLVFAAGWIVASRRGGAMIWMDRHADAGPDGTAASRINLADLRERLRRLEAIAAGIDP
jgi:hypothetical protein